MELSNKYFKAVFFALILLLLNIYYTSGLPTSVDREGGSVHIDDHQSTLSKRNHPIRSKYLNRKCEAGRSYRISDVKDLQNYTSELQCIFLAGHSPTKVPEGAMIGDVVIVYGLPFIKPIGQFVWQGKFVEKLKYNGEDIYRGWNNLKGTPLFSFIATKGKLADLVNIHHLAFKDEKESILINYGTDIQDIVPDYNSFLEANKDKMVVKKSSKNRKFFPLNQFNDVIRLVGKQGDGGMIYLGQMWGNNQFSSSPTAKLYAYFSILNYDQNVNPDFKFGDSLPPLKEDVYYRNVGPPETMNLALPVYELLTEPFYALKQIIRELFQSSRGILYIVTDFCFGSTADSVKFEKSWKASLPLDSNKTDVDISSGWTILSHAGDGHTHYTEL